MSDLDFISGEFFELQIPKDKQFLNKYFKSNLQRSFLRYFLVFGNSKNFVDHTGNYCHRRELYRLEKQYKMLIGAYEDAKRSLTEEGMEIMQLIESGKYRLTR